METEGGGGGGCAWVCVCLCVCGTTLLSKGMVCELYLLQAQNGGFMQL